MPLTYETLPGDIDHLIAEQQQVEKLLDAFSRLHPEPPEILEPEAARHISAAWGASRTAG